MLTRLVQSYRKGTLLPGIRYRAERVWAKRRHAFIRRRKSRRFEAWLAQLRSRPPDVLLGANFAKHGGVRHHLQAIARYSALRIGLAPSERLMASLAPYDFQGELRQRFLDFTPAGVRAVHSHVFPWFIEWCRWQRRRGIRWVHTYHTLYFPQFYQAGLAPWQIEINQALINEAREADVRIAGARWLQSYLAQRHGISTVYIPNGVDVAACDRAVPSHFIRKTGLDRFILYLRCGDDPLKNPQDFVKLAQHLPSETFVMLGEGLTRDSLQDLRVGEIPQNLQVYRPVAHSDVLDAVAACSVLVVTSKTEGMPTLVLEGMALRRPVVVPDVHGCAEAMGDERHGFIYRHENLNDLAEKTLVALADRQRGQRARERVLAEYDWRVVAPKLDAIYRGESRQRD